MTEGLRTSCFLGAYWNIIIMARWTVTIFILLVLRESNEIQILSLWLISIFFQGMLLRGKPFEDKNDNFIGFFIEFMVSAYLYFLILLTDFWGENKFREIVGECLVAVISISITVNIFKLIYNILKGVKEYLWNKRIKLKSKLKIIE